MSIGKWLAQHGDQVCTFASLAAISLKGVDDLPAWVTQLLIVLGILATAAHQSFFPNVPPAQPAPPSESKA